MNIKRISAIAAVAAVLATAVAVPAQAAVPSHSRADTNGFISAMRGQIPETAYLPKSQIHELGDSVCGALRRDPDIEGLALAMYEGAERYFSIEDIGFIIGASASYLCPRETVHVKDYIAANA